MHIDFETYSEAGYEWDPARNRWVSLIPSKPGIEAVGAWAYSAHPSADIISLSYDETLWVPGMPYPQELFDHIAGGRLCWAWNSFFEYCIWTNVAVKKLGWPVLPLGQLRCSMARAKAFGLPGKLAKAGEALNLDILKDKAGSLLIRKLCVPRSPTKHNPLTRLTPESNPKDFNRFYLYNADDTRAERAIKEATPPLSQSEENLWLLDQKINARGVHVDRKGLEDCIAIFNQAQEKYTKELQDITNGCVGTINELEKIRGWMAVVYDLETPSLDAAHVDRLLARQDIPDQVRRVLEIRQILGSASVKKLFSIQRYLSDDDRIRGLFAYYGAERTGRAAGRGPQPQNMPANSIGDVDAILASMSTMDLSVVEAAWGDPLTAISSCLRGLFTAAPGMDLICSDYNSIEAVVLAVLAGEEWRVEVFRTHGKIYEMCASKMTGVPLDEILGHKALHGDHHPLRTPFGKVPELAYGYAGWINAAKAFGADQFMSDDEIKKNILKWRDDSPMIVELWGGQHRKLPGQWKFVNELYGLEGAVVLAILNPGQFYSYRSITYGVKNNVLYCRLPSGRFLCYHQPTLTPYYDDLRGLSYYKISFWGWNSNHLKGPIGWIEIETYGGKLTENVVQAVSRDIMMHGLTNLESAGYPVVLHVHDEPCSEVPKDYGSVEEYEILMTGLPDWAADWPVRASGGWRGLRYRK